MSKHHFVEKGWGSEEWIVNKTQYCGKLLKFNKDKKCSIHYHNLKDETFYLNKGKVWMRWLDIPNGLSAKVALELFEKNHTAQLLETGDSFYVPVGRVHQVVAIEDSEVFEFSTEHFDEDSVRLQKGD